MKNYNVFIVGYGSFGTAISILLSGKGYDVTVTDINNELLKDCEEQRENKRYLPGVDIPGKVLFLPSASGSDDDAKAMEEALRERISKADIIVFAVPAQHFRSGFNQFAKYINDETAVVNVAKGIEIESLKRMSEIAEEIKPGVKYSALSGPSHAEEVGRGLPTTVAVSSKYSDTALFVQEVFFTDRFRVYTNEDIVGVEFGGSLKNIMALGAGISDGLGFGDNAKAAMMTRGIVEMTRLGVAMGAKEETFSGLTGIGDLIVTCTSMHSRNRRCGILIGEGKDPREAVKEVGMVVEGIYTCEAACKLADKYNVDMPITKSIKACIDGVITPDEAINALMSREKKSE